MRFWFAKIKDSGEYIVSITKLEFAEAGKRTILNGLEVIGLGSYEFDGYDDFKANWRKVVEGYMVKGGGVNGV